MVERNMCDAVMRGIVRPAGVEGHITRNRVGSWDISRLAVRVECEGRSASGR
jgi:hypothetical protein